MENRLNKSGIFPVEYKVLIEPVKVKAKTDGGIILPESSKDREKYATVKGKLIAVGSEAFQDPDWKYRPEIGCMVIFDRYAGRILKGFDGEDYRLINDKEICAILTEEF